MPRDPAALANILNGGAATPMFVGLAGPSAATYIEQTAACRWYARSPGGALSLDGVAGCAEAAPGSDFAAFTNAGDLTLESWVRPAGTSGLGRIVACQAAGGRGYTLGLRP